MKIKQKIFCTIIAVIFFFPVLFRLLPFSKLKQLETQEYSARIYDSQNKLIQIIPLKDGGRREYTPIKKIPKHVLMAFIQTEDKRFFFHHGVDYCSLVKAILENTKAKKIVRGSSTITMQLAKIINQSNEPSVKRKIHDIYYAYRIESKLSKRKILELYLNSIYFGKGSWGVTSAARTFFSKELKDITLDEAKILAVMIRNPSFYNPVKYPEHFAHYSLENTAKTASYFNYIQNMPHFVNYIKKHSLKNQYEYKATVDTELFNFSQNLLQDALMKSSVARISNGCLLILDNKDNSVLTWIGNGDFYDYENSGQIDGVLVKNQPGSSMKPFLYALALDLNVIEPSSVLADVPSEFGNDKLYIPENFNNRFNGPVRARIALSSSLNIPAVSILNQIGVNKYLSKLYELNFTSLKEKGAIADLGLALGAGEVTLCELVCAFTVFSRDGIYLPVRTCNEKNNIRAMQVFSKDTSRIICSFLSDKSARALGFGYNHSFQTEYPAIFKTGTSNQFQDIVALGSTKNYTVGVWMGNFSGNTVVGKTGSSVPATIAKRILDYLEGGKNDYTELSFKEPEMYHKEKVCAVSGMKAGDYCDSVVYEYIKNNDSSVICNWHQKINSEIVTIYPGEYQVWARNKHTEKYVDYLSTELKVLTPKNNAVFYLSNMYIGKQAIPCEVIGGTDNKLDVYYDGQLFNTVERPFVFSLPAQKGLHECEFICGAQNEYVSFFVK